MIIEIEVTEKKQVVIDTLIVTIPEYEVSNDDVYDDEGRFPKKFIDEDGGAFFAVDVDTGTVRGWPSGATLDAYFKPRDGGTYQLVSGPNIVLKIEDDYVPKFLDHMAGGDDYLSVKIGPDGKWEGLDLSAARLSEAFEEN